MQIQGSHHIVYGEWNLLQFKHLLDFQAVVEDFESYLSRKLTVIAGHMQLLNSLFKIH
jgi:hypothetical protein